MMTTIFRNWYIPASMFLILINNQISTMWVGDKTPHVSWDGSDGFPNDYHYWYMFDYRAQMYIMAALAILVLKYPPKEKYLNYGITCIALNYGIALIEDLRYMYYANNVLNESLYPAYLMAYTACVIAAAFYHKIFKNGIS